jgi:glycosyltransferase involved in cell wall biosynthesis
MTPPIVHRALNMPPPVQATSCSSSKGLSTAPTIRKRVLHVINGEHYAGAERVQDLLASNLPEHGYDVGLACVKPDVFPKMRAATAAPLYMVPMRSRFDLRAARKLCRIAADDDYHLLHAHTPRTLLLAALASRMTGRPLIYHVHSPAARDSTRRFQNWLNGRIETTALRQVTHVIAVSSSLARHMAQNGYDPDRLSVVPNGVPTPNQRRGAVRPMGRWVLGTVALFRPRKGMEFLLEAVARLRELRRDVALVAVGPCESETYERRLRRTAAELGLNGAIRWTGLTTDVNAQLSRMDLFVLPSLFGEGLPMVVLEAMAAGVPVVATSVEGIPEVIRDRENGILVRPGQADQLVDAIRGIMDGRHDWQALRRSALQRHAERFSDRAMAAGVARVYGSLIGATGRV